MKVPKDVLKNCGCGTQREWRALKSTQLRAVSKAMDEVLRGCLYTPKVDGIYLGTMRYQLRQLQEAWSAKRWGR